jgi:hypothetical protein
MLALLTEAPGLPDTRNEAAASASLQSDVEGSRTT